MSLWNNVENAADNAAGGAEQAAQDAADATQAAHDAADSASQAAQNAADAASQVAQDAADNADDHFKSAADHAQAVDTPDDIFGGFHHGAFDQSVNEANEKADIAMQSAFTSMVTGIIGAAAQIADSTHVVDNVGSMFDQMQRATGLEYNELKQDTYDSVDSVTARIAELAKEGQLHHDNAAIDQVVHEANEKADIAMQSALTSMVTGIVAGAAQIGDSATSSTDGDHNTTSSGRSDCLPAPHFELLSMASDLGHHWHF